MRSALPWQVPAIEFGRTRTAIPILMERRLGKCFVATRILADKADALLNLIVAPKSAIPDWLNELRADGFDPILLEGSKSERFQQIFRTVEGSQFSGGSEPERIFFVTNPEALTVPASKRKGTEGGPSDIAQVPWDSVVWDEITKIRNPQTLIAETAIDHLAKAKYKIGLSGDIRPESDADVFNPMKWFFGFFMGHKNFWKWREEFFRTVGYSWVPLPGKMNEIKEALDTRSFRLTRTDAGIGEVKTFERRYCDLPQKSRTAYERLEKYYELEEGCVVEDEAKYALEVANWLSQLAGGYMKDKPEYDSGHKMSLLLELLTGEYAHESTVCLFRYNLELANACATCRKKGVSCAMIFGETPISERIRLQADFKARRLRVLLMQIKVAKFGIDLSAADTMIRYSMTYSYEDVSQSEDRIVHPLKKVPLHYIDLVTRNTVDEDLVEVIQNKKIDAKMFMSKLRSRLLDRLRAGKAR